MTPWRSPLLIGIGFAGGMFYEHTTCKAVPSCPAVACPVPCSAEEIEGIQNALCEKYSGPGMISVEHCVKGEP